MITSSGTLGARLCRMAVGDSVRMVGHSSGCVVQVFGSIPMRSLTADEIRWVQPR
jgi:hypothetical protein